MSVMQAHTDNPEILACFLMAALQYKGAPWSYSS